MKIHEYAETRKQSQNNVRQVVYRMAKDPKWKPYIIYGDTREGYDLLPEAVDELDRHYLKSVKLSVDEYNGMVDEISQLRDEVQQLRTDNRNLSEQNKTLTDKLLENEKPKSLWRRLFGG